jgi:hypothetical protein
MEISQNAQTHSGELFAGQERLGKEIVSVADALSEINDSGRYGRL